MLLPKEASASQVKTIAASFRFVPSPIEATRLLQTRALSGARRETDERVNVIRVWARQRTR
jgi:hypothetical protein